MKIFSMFSGIGGFEEGIRQAYEQKNNKQALQSADVPTESERKEKDKEIGNSGGQCGELLDESQSGFDGNNPSIDLRSIQRSVSEESKNKHNTKDEFSEWECVDSAEMEKFDRKENGKSQGDKKKNDEKQERLVTKESQESDAERGRISEYLDINSTRSKSFACVGYSEIDKYAISIYKKHFPNHKNYGDITKVNGKELPEFDLLCGGVPCQSWSIAGKRGGFDDPRGNMWFECFKILRAKQPKYFLFENVKGLLSHDGGRSMERICEEFCDCGYAIDFEVLNSKNFGVPQSRKRVFILGIRLDLLDEKQIF